MPDALRLMSRRTTYSDPHGDLVLATINWH